MKVSLSDEIAELQVIQDESKIVAEKKRDTKEHAKGWERGVEITGGAGYVYSGPVDTPPGEGEWDGILNEFGLDPEKYEINPDAVLDMRVWDMAVGSGVVQRMHYYRAPVHLRGRYLWVPEEEFREGLEDFKPPPVALREAVYSEPNAYVVCLADWQIGKALEDSTPVLTPTGWVDHGELRPGDMVYGPEGKPVEVTATTGSSVLPMYQLTWDDGTVTYASDNHLWEGWRRYKSWPGNAYERRRVTVTTAELAEMKKSESRGRSYYSRPFHVDLCEPVLYPDSDLVDLPVDPYLLGAWLGDGSSQGGRLSSSFEDADHWLDQLPGAYLIVPNGHCATVSVPNLTAALTTANLAGSKHVPEAYLRSSVEDRLALVQGLMDTDGSVNDKGVCEFTQVRTQIADALVELLRSLGIKVKRSLKATSHQDAHRIQFTPNADLWYQRVFRMERKLAKLRHGVGQWSYSYLRSVERVEPMSAQCITVDGSLYLAGSELRVTHNSEGDGTVGIRNRIMASAHRSLDRLHELRRMGIQIETVYIIGMGDMVEACDGHYAMQSFKTDLNERQQFRLAARLFRNIVAMFAAESTRVVVASVGGNHGENRKNGKAFTDPGDNKDTQLVEVTADRLSENEEAFGHVHFVPLENKLWCTLDIYGTSVGFSHGHLCGGGSGGAPEMKQKKWISNQALAKSDIGDVDLFVTGHFHSFQVSDWGPRMWLQCPTQDGGSEWFQNLNGSNSATGTLTFVCGPSAKTHADFIRVV